MQHQKKQPTSSSSSPNSNFAFVQFSCSATSCLFFWTSISIHRRPKQQIWPPELKISLLVSRHCQSLSHSRCSCPSCPLRFDEQAFSSHRTQSGHSVHTPSHTERRSESSGRYSGECPGPSRTRTCVHGLSHGRNSLNGRNDIWIRGQQDVTTCASGDVYVAIIIRASVFCLSAQKGELGTKVKPDAACLRGYGVSVTIQFATSCSDSFCFFSVMQPVIT